MSILAPAKPLKYKEKASGSRFGICFASLKVKFQYRPLLGLIQCY
jgi:hypothetical protein